MIRENTHRCVNHARVSQHADDDHDGEDENHRGPRQRFYDRQPHSLLTGMTKMPRSVVLLHLRDYSVVVLSSSLFLCLCFCLFATSLLPFWSSELLLHGKFQSWKLYNGSSIGWLGFILPNWMCLCVAKVENQCTLFLRWRRRRTKEKIELVHDA